MRRVLAVFVTAAALLAFAVELAGTLPAPTLPLLALGVLVPELAPRCAAVCLGLVVAAVGLVRGRLRVLAAACAGTAFALALVPLAEFPVAQAAAERALADAGFAAGPPGPDFVPAAPVAGAAADARTNVLADRPVRARDGARLGLDVYRSARGGARPTIVTIYGGAWRFGQRADTAALDRIYAAQGYTVIAIDYRHAPEHRFPTQIDDVRAALSTIAAHARAWNVDPTRVALYGQSAGAELALLGAFEASALRVRAVVAYYAPTDLVAGYDDPPRPDPADVREILRAYLGGPPQTRRAAYAAASPLAHVRAHLPPTLLFVGLRDALVRVEQQRALRDALRASGDTVVAVELPWSNHVFDAVPGGLGRRLAQDVTQRFLAAALR